jgi:hypothetical protein
MTDVYGWHFVAADRHLGYEDGREVVVGETLTVSGPLVMCKWGLHASPRAIDALGYAPGPVACYVRLSGEVLEPTAEHPDKMCATERTVLAMVDATDLLRDFIRDTLIYRQPHIVTLFEGEGLHAYAKAIGDADLRTMGWSEMALIFTAARDAAQATEDAARVGDAAWYAAWYAAQATGDAARVGDAAWYAAWAAQAAAEVAAVVQRRRTGDAGAAWDAARDDLNAMLEARLREAMGL